MLNNTIKTMGNLFDICCGYIEDSHSAEGVLIADEKIYNYCCDYINSLSDCPRHIEGTLRNYFSKYLY